MFSLQLLFSVLIWVVFFGMEPNDISRRLIPLKIIFFFHARSVTPISSETGAFFLPQRKCPEVFKRIGMIIYVSARKKYVHYDTSPVMHIFLKGYFYRALAIL